MARLVNSPNHYRKNGKIKPGVFPPSHIAKSGVSLMRVEHMPEEFISEMSNAIASQLSGQTASGLLIRTASDVRGIQDDDGLRALCLLDDP
ncbi:hypothetical protein G6L07_03035 [Agrobacterium rhizogenes]|nr:hypothetical protein [Rhizobium rhizogenes]